MARSSITLGVLLFALLACAAQEVHASVGQAVAIDSAEGQATDAPSVVSQDAPAAPLPNTVTGVSQPKP